jgi:hypothetical protein
VRANELTSCKGCVFLVVQATAEDSAQDAKEFLRRVSEPACIELNSWDSSGAPLPGASSVLIVVLPRFSTCMVLIYLIHKQNLHSLFFSLLLGNTVETMHS